MPNKQSSATGQTKSRLSKPSDKLKKVKKEDIYEYSKNFYLLPIIYQPLTNPRFFHATDNAQNAELYYDRYINWKKKKLDYMKNIVHLIDQTKTKLACAQCGVS